MPIPLSKRSVTREMPHPSGCSSQVRPLLVCVRPTKMMCLLGGGTGASGKLLFIILRWMCKSICKSTLALLFFVHVVFVGLSGDLVVLGLQMESVGDMDMGGLFTKRRIHSRGH